MNLKPNLLPIGITLVFAGSLLFYFEDYRNSQIIDFVEYMLIIMGWALIFAIATKGTSIQAPKILYKDDKGGWFKQRCSNLLYAIIFFAVIFGDVYYAGQWGLDRKRQILQTEPTKTTTAIINYIDVRHSRHSTSYYAVFSYTANGVATSHPWHEYKESDFLVGDKYMIKYSVQYPEMMMILQKMP